MAKSARVLGVHPVAAEEPVHLIELEVVGDPDDFDFGEVTQEVAGEPRENWQAVWDERPVGATRVAFSFH